jgi:hypothetical protein
MLSQMCADIRGDKRLGRLPYHLLKKLVMPMQRIHTHLILLDGNGLIVEHSTGMPMRPTFVRYMVNRSYGTSSMTLTA